AGSGTALAFDIPLNEPPEAVIDRVVARVCQECYAGLILLVDMGSLVYLAEKVQFATGVPVRVLPLASTPLVVEAIHHATTPGATLDHVHAAVLDAQRQMLESVRLHGTRRPVVVTCCFTGEGSAILLKSVVERALGIRGQLVDVVSMSIPQGEDWQRALTPVLAGRQPLALIGPVNPAIAGIPFLHSGEVVTAAGQERLVALVEQSTRGSVPEALLEASPAPADIATTLATTLATEFMFTNPFTLLPRVMEAADAMEAKLGAKIPSDIRVGLLMHLATLVERRASERGAAAAPRTSDPRLAELDHCLSPLRETFHAAFRPEDLVRIYEVLTNTVYRPKV
ncbi:MAG TPA: hypothetical protein VNT75_01550, partial [Symbiobacteriaceae bacterium]|nr:hypothetical protein [Symbiobacteriaceae bacterium]